jgi:hypothetical protein
MSIKPWVFFPCMSWKLMKCCVTTLQGSSVYHKKRLNTGFPVFCFWHASQISSSPETIYPHRWQVVKKGAGRLVFVAIIEIWYHRFFWNANLVNTFFSLQWGYAHDSPRYSSKRSETSRLI